ncbi:hypothetical protein [Staphylococcus aureus]|uniref:hypothetical protein n=1 Tax=Staphylococcus aureus TaxID=1280 RepID=UPI000AD41081|nr:hypothetical protein [Staphylococcus aureus]
MSGVINYQFRLNGVLIFKIEFLIYYYVWYTNQCFMLYKVILAVVDCGPQTQKLAESQLTITCKLAGPQHSGIGFPISTDIASWRGHNIEKLDPQFLQTMQVGETGHKHKSWRKVSFYEYNKKAR